MLLNVKPSDRSVDERSRTKCETHTLHDDSNPLKIAAGQGKNRTDALQLCLNMERASVCVTIQIENISTLPRKYIIYRLHC